MRGVLVVLPLACAAGAHAASFNCARATTPQEKAICANPQMSAADDRMAAAYKAILAAGTPEIVGAVRQEQRAWVLALSAKCKPDSADALLSCLWDEYSSRTSTLEHMILHEGGVTFVWQSVSFSVPDSPDALEIDRKQGAQAEASSFDASWPQVNGTSPEWQAWNKAIEAAAKDLASQGQAAPGDGWKKEWAQDMDTNVTTSIGWVSAQMVTATVDNQWYGHGAAHPNENSEQFNWMLKEKRLLQPGDIFRAGSGWESKLYRRCDAYLHSELDEEYGQDYKKSEAPGALAETLHGIVRNPANWILDSKAITIVFQTYAVACRACTPPPLVIPWIELKPLLNQNFVIPTALVPPDGNSPALMPPK